MFKFVRSKSVWLILPFYCCFRFLFSEISLRTFCSVWNFQGCITVYLSRCCSSQKAFFSKNIRSVSQTAYWVYHKQFGLSRTFFILFSGFFRSPVAYHSQQQFISLSEPSAHVKHFFIFLNFFSEIRVAFVRRNSHKVYQDCLSMSSSFLFFSSLFFRRFDFLSPFHKPTLHAICVLPRVCYLCATCVLPGKK